MLRGKHQPSGAEDRVGARSKDIDVVGVRDAKRDVCAFAATDPITLRLQRNLAPVQSRKIVEQALRELRDAEEPLLEQPLFDQRFAALTAAVDHLFVGQHGLVVRAPVDGGGLLVGQPLLVELEEKPLRPLVIAGFASDYFLAPVQHQAGALQLASEVFDVSRGQRGRVHPDLDCVVLGLDPEAVESDWFEDGPALLPLEPPVDVRARECEQVADVKPFR